MKPRTRLPKGEALEEAIWLMDGGVHPENVCKALNLSPRYLLRLLEKGQATWYAAKFRPYVTEFEKGYGNNDDE